MIDDFNVEESSGGANLPGEIDVGATGFDVPRRMVRRDRIPLAATIKQLRLLPLE